MKHGRARVNGIRMHYVTTGQGEPLLLLHGTPKTHYYWYKLIPLLTELLFAQSGHRRRQEWPLDIVNTPAAVLAEAFATLSWRGRSSSAGT